MVSGPTTEEWYTSSVFGFASVGTGASSKSLHNASNVAKNLLQSALKSGAKELSDVEIGAILKAATHNPNKGKIVLGHFEEGGGYVKKAEEIGSTFFSTGNDLWQALEQRLSQFDANQLNDQIWRINKKFIDDAIARGDEIFLSHTKARPGTFFERELKYLRDMGYELVDDRMIKK
jgi:hypothetical protein